MTPSTSPPDTQPLLLDVRNTTVYVTPEQFDRLCIDNPDLRLELSKDRELIVMPPTGGEISRKNGDLFGQVWYWNKQTKSGKVFDSSGGYDFTSIGGGKMSPDVSWIEKSHLEGVNIKGFIPIVPDFVIELRSESDRLITLQKKMQEYQRLGVRLGLLIDPQRQEVEVYRPEQTIEMLESPLSIDCSEVMSGFVLSLSEIW
jgi:Uma2 family endonuclease